MRTLPDHRSDVRNYCEGCDDWTYQQVVHPRYSNPYGAWVTKCRECGREHEVSAAYAGVEIPDYYDPAYYGLRYGHPKELDPEIEEMVEAWHESDEREQLLDELEVGGALPKGEPGGDGRGDGRGAERRREREERAGPGAVRASDVEDVGSQSEIVTGTELIRRVGRVEWLWRPWLAKGMVTVLFGVPDVGKSALALTLGRVVIEGGKWPDGTWFEGERGLCVYVDTENFLRGHRERLERWELPDGGYRFLVGPNQSSVAGLDTPEGRAALRKVEGLEDVRLVIVDSFSAAHGLDENTTAAGQVIVGLQGLAARTGAAVLVIHHPRKPGPFENAKPTLEKMRGSSAIGQMARIVWGAWEPDEKQAGAVRVDMVKNNLAASPPPFGYEVRADGVVYGDAPEVQEKIGETEKAERFLEELAPDFPIASTTIYQQGEAMGLSKRTIRRAKDRLGYVSVQEADGWYYEVPEDDQEGEGTG